MAKNTPTDTSTVQKEKYSFPELGITVEAESLEIATEMAKKHPDVIYNNNL